MPASLAHHDDQFGLAGGLIEFEMCGAITNAVHEILDALKSQRRNGMATIVANGIHRTSVQ